jgi:hypothetical protein
MKTMRNFYTGPDDFHSSEFRYVDVLCFESPQVVLERKPRSETEKSDLEMSASKPNFKMMRPERGPSETHSPQTPETCKHKTQ